MRITKLVQSLTVVLAVLALVALGACGKKKEGEGGSSGGGKWIALGFTDKGAAAKAKGVKQGDPLKAKCKVGGADANYVMNTDCELM